MNGGLLKYGLVLALWLSLTSEAAAQNKGHYFFGNKDDESWFQRNFNDDVYSPFNFYIHPLPALLGEYKGTLEWRMHRHRSLMADYSRITPTTPLFGYNAQYHYYTPLFSRPFIYDGYSVKVRLRSYIGKRSFFEQYFMYKGEQYGSQGIAPPHTDWLSPLRPSDKVNVRNEHVDVQELGATIGEQFHHGHLILDLYVGAGLRFRNIDRQLYYTYYPEKPSLGFFIPYNQFSSFREIWPGIHAGVSIGFGVGHGKG
jgi:hypothetical protein